MDKQKKRNWLDRTNLDEEIKEAILSATNAERITWMLIGAISTLLTAGLLRIVF